jgi:glycosyltransferase involved in cell wall biosynthesis
VWEETFGLVVIEAMAAGVPAIAPAHASFPDFIRSGHDGVLVAPHSAPALAEAMAGLLDRPEQALAMGVHARRTYEERYRPEPVMARLIELYEIARRRRTGTAAASAPHTSEGASNAPLPAEDPTR